MPSITEITLPFLGNRGYLQGPTLFDAMRARLPSMASLSCKITQQIMTDRIRLEHLSSAEKPSGGYSASLSWNTGEFGGLIGAIPLTLSSNPQRVPYDESLITDRIIFAERSATLNAISPYSFAATITSMLKALLLRADRQSEPGQWLFARLDCTYVPRELVSTSVKIDEMLVGGRFVRASVLLAGMPIGSLYFSWSAKATTR